MALLDDKIKDRALAAMRTLSRLAAVRAIYVFGSQVEGRSDKWSDIDLAIVSNDFAGNRFEDRSKIRKISLQVNSDISPMPFRPEDFNDSDYFVK